MISIPPDGLLIKNIYHKLISAIKNINYHEKFKKTFKKRITACKWWNSNLFTGLHDRLSQMLYTSSGILLCSCWGKMYKRRNRTYHLNGNLQFDEAVSLLREPFFCIKKLTLFLRKPLIIIRVIKSYILKEYNLNKRKTLCFNSLFRLPVVFLKDEIYYLWQKLIYFAEMPEKDDTHQLEMEKLRLEIF